jgi:copper homeostasis protein
MRTRPLLEISVETIEAALAAVRGGADRLELCRDLPAGGLTPSAAMMRAAREKIELPIFVMIRPREGDFCYSPAEFDEMKRQIELAAKMRMDGLVLGILTRTGSVDVRRVAELVQLAKPLPVTFHRAFDEAKGVRQAELSRRLEDVILTGTTRLLTSGGAPTAEEGCRKIASLVRKAADRFTILPGGGIRPGNLRSIVQKTLASEFHSGLGSLIPYPRRRYEEFEAGVRELVRVLEEESGGGEETAEVEPPGRSLA